jgi:hypothetical protein
MSSALASSVHGSATPRLNVGFAANTQDHTSHSLGPKAPLKPLTSPFKLSSLLERESRRDLSEGKEFREKGVRQRERDSVTALALFSSPVLEFTGYQP